MEDNDKKIEGAAPQVEDPKAKKEAETKAAAEAKAKEEAETKAAAEAKAKEEAEAKANPYEKIGVAILKNNPKMEEVFVTSDGVPFFGKCDADNHARTLKDKNVYHHKKIANAKD